MPNLRDMLDDKTVWAGSPAAKHVSQHIQDPVGATKEGFGKLTQKKLDYDQAREEMQRQLTMPQAVINHVSQIHNLQPNQDQMMDQGMDPNDPNAMVDEDGLPVNMNQTVGKMNSNRPSLAGNQPGVAPGPQQSVVPPKLGQATPGGGQARNSPQPGNAQGNTYNKTAAPPKGNKSLPGAKGPGDSKVQKRTDQAQGKSGRAIKVNVTASATSIPVIHASSTITTQFGFGSLKSGGIKLSGRTVLAAVDLSETDLRNMLQEALKDKTGTSGDSPCGVSSKYAWINDIFPLQNYFVYNSDGKSYRQDFKLVDGNVTLKGDPKRVKLAYVKAGKKKKKIKAGPAALADKVTDNSGDNVAYNPVIK